MNIHIITIDTSTRCKSNSSKQLKQASGGSCFSIFFNIHSLLGRRILIVTRGGLRNGVFSTFNYMINYINHAIVV